jgi:glyoxylase-like metal-dependent hydrolase (beta-lactamase superfamily II)
MDGTPRPPRQEQEDAGVDVVEVAPGVLRSQLPIDMPGLGHTNCYMIEDRRGVALVDPGLPGRATRRAIAARLRTAGVPMRRVHTVVVTHSHPDHYGGAAYVRSESGADIVTHRGFEMFWDRLDPGDLDAEDAAPDDASADEQSLVRRESPFDPPPWGGQPMKMSPRLRAWYVLARVVPRFAGIPRPTVRVEDAQTLTLGDREWIAVHTPGHTEDHLCLFDPTEGVMMSGDHVLPTITPHISGLGRGDALSEFFDSLDKVSALGPDVTVVLPAHGHPFSDLAGRAKAIREHHLVRLELVRAAARDAGHPLSVQEVSTVLFSARAQGPLADSETFAHLEHLRRAGELSRADTVEGFRYRSVG